MQATFTGQEYDEETNIQYFGARYMDNEIGKFISIDPAILKLHDPDELRSIVNGDINKVLVNPQQLNSYSYVTNNPVKYNDPNGEWLDTVLDVGFIVYDSYKIAQSYVQTGQADQEYVNSLKLDALGAVIPGATGLGLVARTAKVTNKADNIVGVAAHSDDLLKVADNVPKPKVFDTTLKEGFIDQLFKDKDKFIGGTAQAIRRELSGLGKVGGKPHLEKGRNAIRGLERWIGKSKGALQSDINTATRVLNDLKDSFKLK